MNKISTLFLVLVFLNTSVFIQAQNNPFSVKKKLPGKSIGFPQAVQPLSNVKKRSIPSQSQFQPLQANFNTLKLDRQVFSNPGFNANGRLIFVEGRLPASNKSYEKGVSDQEQSIEYLTALKQVLGIADPASEFEITKIRLRRTWYSTYKTVSEVYGNSCLWWRNIPAQAQW